MLRMIENVVTFLEDMTFAALPTGRKTTGSRFRANPFVPS